ncbi:MAG: hypothetical protein K6E29_01035, partial [Cyanobacteria bacterium RUI128]|nr:hypothetical protein [Cyanobacteria bacterium RUI128]
DGALISGSGSYSAFVDYIASIYDASANYFCSENDWQTAVNTYGVCGKFVYNSTNNTVRLPKYGNQIYTNGVAPVVGNGISLGLTDGTNDAAMGYLTSSYARLFTSVDNFGGAVGSTTPSGASGLTNLKTIGVTTDKTKSGLIADLITLDGYYYIVIANSTKTEIEVDIDEIATDLNGKADKDLSNCTKPYVKYTYTNTTSGYIVFSNKFCIQWGRKAVTANTANIGIDLNLTMADTNYNTDTTCYYNANYSSSNSNCNYNSAATYAAHLSSTLTSSKITVAYAYSGYTILWKVTGYISDSQFTSLGG